MKARILPLAAAIFSLTLIFTACQKDSSSDSTASQSEEASKHSDDQSSFSSDIDEIDSDVNLAMESSSSFSGRGNDIQSLMCNATVTIDTLNNPRSITIVYNGLNCVGNYSRTGTLKISMPNNIRWKDAGAAITVTATNLKITRVIDNKSITINGSHVYTNVTGGLLANLSALGTIRHTVTSDNMSVTFDNGSQRTWKIAQQREFTFNNGINITTTGLHSENGVNGIAEWGTNRFGRAFTSAIVTPVVIRQDCSFRITSGKIQHKTTLVDASATFGLDITGAPTTCPAGLYYMKIEWTGPLNVPHSVILPY